MIVKIIPKKMYCWQQYFIDNMKRYNVLVAPRQHGKTELMSELIKSIVYDDKIKNPCINLCSDTKLRLEGIYRERLDKMFSVHDDWKWPGKNQTFVRIKRPIGDTVKLNIFGARQQPNAPEGTTSHLNIVDEAGYVSRRFIKGALMPTAQFTGGYTIATGTVDPGDFFDLYLEAREKMNQKDSNWFCFSFKLDDAYSMDCISPKKRAAIIDMYNFDNPEDRILFAKHQQVDWFAGQYGAPLAVAYTKAEKSGRIGNFPVDLNYKVGTAWDNGMGVKACWFYQVVRNTPRFVGFRLWQDESLKKACKDVLEWYKQKNVEHYYHILPHTMGNKEESDGVRLVKKFKDYIEDGEIILNRRVSNLENKIENTIEVLGSCLFDVNTCRQGLLSLVKYRRKIGSVERSKSIVKDIYSHGADAMTEFALAWENNLKDVGYTNFYDLIQPKEESPLFPY